MAIQIVETSSGPLQIDIPPNWPSVDVPGTEGTWVAPSERFDFLPNVVVTETVGETSYGAELAENVVLLLGEFPDALLIDLNMPDERDLRVAVSYLNTDGTRLTMLQRTLVSDVGSVSVTFTVPDLAVAELEDVWRAALGVLSLGEQR